MIISSSSLLAVIGGAAAFLSLFETFFYTRRRPRRLSQRVFRLVLRVPAHNDLELASAPERSAVQQRLHRGPSRPNGVFFCFLLIIHIAGIIIEVYYYYYYKRRPRTWPVIIIIRIVIIYRIHITYLLYDAYDKSIIAKNK